MCVYLLRQDPSMHVRERAGEPKALEERGIPALEARRKEQATKKRGPSALVFLLAFNHPLQALLLVISEHHGCKWKCKEGGSNVLERSAGLYIYIQICKHMRMYVKKRTTASLCICV